MVSWKFVVTVFRLALFALAVSGAWAQTSPLIGILDEELHRNFETLRQKGDPPPYFISYEVTEQENDVLAASMGALTSSNHSAFRFLDVVVRVGSPKLDNYHGSADRSRVAFGAAIPIDDAPNAIKRLAWLETDRAYRNGVERLIQVKTNEQVKVAAEDDSADFSEEKPSTSSESAPKLRFNTDDWASRIRKLSAEFGKYNGILSSTVNVVVQRQTKYFVSSEGSKIQQGRTTAQISILARGKAVDGMDLAVHRTFEAEDPSRLPKEDVIRAAVDKVGADLSALLHAPVIDPFVGPAILSGNAAGVFFHEIFGHRIEGHRQKDEAEGQTFTKSINQPVLPAFLSVVFDPARKYIDNTYLNGYYQYDDEGVKGQPVTVVDHGILKTFLLSRSPIHGFSNSNGHGRHQPGMPVVSRQSNLIVESAKAVSEAKLRDLLREELKRQNKPYGLYFSQVTGGYTTTGRRGLQAFTVIPLIVYRVFADGRPDELVRGADIVGTPLASFAKIIATSDKPEVFNGICGAESGSVPVSATSPALLISEIEVQRKDRSQDRPPLLPRPTVAGE